MALKLSLGRVAIDGSITAGSTTLSSALLLATSADVGKGIDVLGAGPGGATLVSTIAAVGSGTVTLANAASTTVGPVAGVSDGATITVWTPFNPARESIQYNNSLTNRDTMSFSASRIKNPGVVPVVGQPVLLQDTLLGDLFGGSIDEVQATQIPGNYTATYDCQCVSWDSLASKRTTGQPEDEITPKAGKFSGCAAGGIITWLANHCMGTDISAVNVVTGPTIDEISFDYTDCASAFDSVCKAATSDVETYIWRMDARRNLYFEVQSTSIAPWNVHDNFALVAYSVTRTREKYANRAFVTPTAEDGSIDNPNVASYTNSAAVDERSAVEGGTGFYDLVVGTGDVNISTSPSTLAESLAKAYGKIPDTVEYSTYRGGLRAGMLQTIYLSDLGISGTFLIDSVSLSTTAGASLWAIHAVDGALIGDWRTAFAQLAGGSGGGALSGGTSTGGTGTAGTPPSNVTLGTITTAARGPMTDITIPYTAPAVGDTFLGVNIEIEAPDQSASPSSKIGTISLGTTPLASPPAPQTFGPFYDSAVHGVIQVTIQTPTPLPMTCLARAISFSDQVINDAATSPTETFTIGTPAPNKPSAATAYCQNASFTVGTPVPFKPSGR